MAGLSCYKPLFRGSWPVSRQQCKTWFQKSWNYIERIPWYLWNESTVFLVLLRWCEKRDECSPLAAVPFLLRTCKVINQKIFLEPGKNRRLGYDSLCRFGRGERWVVGCVKVPVWRAPLKTLPSGTSCWPEGAGQPLSWGAWCSFRRRNTWWEMLRWRRQ